MEYLIGAVRALGPRIVDRFDTVAANPVYARFAFAATLLLALIIVARMFWPRERLNLRGKFVAPARGQAFSSSGTPSVDDEEIEVTRIGTFANKVFLQFETIAYIALGVLLAVTVVLGITGTGTAVLGAALGQSGENTLVFTVDRMLFVLMVVEILRTVRDSFRSGTLVSEPFLIVGLIASIRRVLVITLESSQVNRPGVWTPASQGLFNASMLELGVLGALILVMVVSIFLLRLSRRFPAKN